MKFLKFLVVLSVLFLIGGCGASAVKMFTYHSNAPLSKVVNYREFPVFLDDRFTVEERKNLEASISEWNWALNGQIKLVVNKKLVNGEDLSEVKDTLYGIRQTGQGYLILRLNHDDPLLEDTVDEDDGTLAFVNALGNRGHLMVVVADRIGTRDLRRIVLHEFGHLMGAMHVMAKSLMFPSYGDGYPCIDKITILQAANYHKLDPNHLNYCSVPNLE